MIIVKLGDVILNDFSVESLIEQDFSQRIRSSLVFSINEGYRFFAEHIEKNDFLQQISARKSYGYIKNAIIDIVLKKEINRSGIPLTYREEKVRGYTYLVLQTNHADMTISKVNTPAGLPPKAKNRQFRSEVNYELNKQLSLFKYEQQVKEKIIIPKKYYLILTHGGKALDKPEFIKLGAISPTQKSWLGHQYDLTNVFRLIQTEPFSNEEEEEINLELHEELKKKFKVEGE